MWVFCDSYPHLPCTSVNSQSVFVLSNVSEQSMYSSSHAKKNKYALWTKRMFLAKHRFTFFSTKLQIQQCTGRSNAQVPTVYSKSKSSSSSLFLVHLCHCTCLTFFSKSTPPPPPGTLSGHK